MTFFHVSLFGKFASHTIGLEHLFCNAYLFSLGKTLYPRSDIHRMAEVVQSIFSIDCQRRSFMYSNFEAERVFLPLQPRIELVHLLHHLKSCPDAVYWC